MYCDYALFSDDVIKATRTTWWYAEMSY